MFAYKINDYFSGKGAHSKRSVRKFVQQWETESWLDYATNQGQTCKWGSMLTLCGSILGRSPHYYFTMVFYGLESVL